MGVDNCAINIDNGNLESIEELLQSEEVDNTDTATGLNLESNTNNESKDSKGNLGAGLGAGLGTAIGVMLLGSVIAYTYLKKNGATTIESKARALLNTALVATPSVKGAEDALGRFRGYLKATVGVTSEGQFKEEFRHNNLDIQQKAYASYTEPAKIRELWEKSPGVTKLDRGNVSAKASHVRKLGWDMEDLIRAGGKYTPDPTNLDVEGQPKHGTIEINLTQVEGIHAKALAAKSKNLIAILGDPNKTKTYLAAYDLARAEADGPKAIASELDIKTAKPDGKLSTKKASIAGFAIGAIAIIAGAMAGLGAGGAFGLTSAPQQDLFTTLTSIRKQILEIKGDLALLWGQINACTPD
jgi:hypothetical protein